MKSLFAKANSEFARVALSWAIEFGPIVVFFFTAEKLGLLRGTSLFVGLTALALAVAYAKDRRIALFPLIAGLSVIAFGLLTVLLQDPFYIIIKDTVYNGGFAVALAIGLFVYEKPPLKRLFSSLFHMTDKGWTILSKRWMVMFVLLAASNEFARFGLDSQGWVKYKMAATFATIVFGFYQITLSRRERLPDSNAWGMNVK